MRISDWSSDVCSADLKCGPGERCTERHGKTLRPPPLPRNAKWGCDCDRSRAAALTSARSPDPLRWKVRKSVLAAGDQQPLDPDGRNVDAVFEHQVVGRGEAAEDVAEMAGDGQLQHREGQLPILDPEAGSTPAVVTGKIGRASCRERVCQYV